VRCNEILALKGVDIFGVRGLIVFSVYCTNLHIVIIICGCDFSPYLEFPRYVFSRG